MSGTSLVGAAPVSPVPGPVHASHRVDPDRARKIPPRHFASISASPGFTCGQDARSEGSNYVRACGGSLFCLGAGRFHTCRLRVIHAEYHAVAESFGEPGREKNCSYRICMCLDYSNVSLRRRGDPRLAGSHRSPRQGADAGDNLRPGAQVQWGQSRLSRRSQLTYGMAEGEIDEGHRRADHSPRRGGAPDSLPTVRTSLETAGKGLKEICDAAVKTVTPYGKGVWEALAKGRGRTVDQGDFRRRVGGALWTRHAEKDKLEIETKKKRVGGGENGPSSATSPRNSDRPFRAGGAPPSRRRSRRIRTRGTIPTFTTARCSPLIPACIRPRFQAQAVDAAGRYAVTGKRRSNRADLVGRRRKTIGGDYLDSDRA